MWCTFGYILYDEGDNDDDDDDLVFYSSFNIPLRKHAYSNILRNFTIKKMKKLRRKILVVFIFLI